MSHHQSPTPDLARAGGGTDVNQVIVYCQGLAQRAPGTTKVLLSDLIEGRMRAEMLERVGAIVASGVTVA